MAFDRVMLMIAALEAQYAAVVVEHEIARTMVRKNTHLRQVSQLYQVGSLC